MAKAKKPKPEDTSKVVRGAEDAPVEEHFDDDLVVGDAEEEVAPLLDEDEDAAVVVEEEALETPAAAGEEEAVALEGEEEVAAQAVEAEDEAVAVDDEASTLTADPGDVALDADTGDTGPPEDAVEEAVEEPPPPRPKVTVLTLVLCILVLLSAAGAFAIVALDFAKRQEASYVVYLHDLRLMGLPLAEETLGRSASRESMAPVRIDPEDLSKAFSGRPGVERKGSEKFQAVHEVFATRIRPEDIGPDTKDLIFKGLGEPVTTLEQEVERVKKRLLADIDMAAKQAGKDLKDDNSRRKLAEKVLQPLARTPDQVYALDQKIKTAKGDELNALLEKGARLQMLAAVLDPLNEERPVQPKNRVLENLADVDNPKVVDEAEALVRKRIDAVLADRHDPVLFGEPWAGRLRNSVDKREAIAYLLFTIGQVKKPDGQFLYPKGAERAEVVVGLNETTHAADRYAHALHAIQNRVTRLHNYELAGYRFEDGAKIEVLPEFAQKYPEEIKNIQDLRAVIKNREFRLKELQAQVTQLTRQLADRQQHYDTVQKELIAARAKTAREAAELEKLQREYFVAQRSLADAAERNAQKEQQIRKSERALRGQSK